MWCILISETFGFFDVFDDFAHHHRNRAVCIEAFDDFDAFDDFGISPFYVDHVAAPAGGRFRSRALSRALALLVGPR